MRGWRASLAALGCALLAAASAPPPAEAQGLNVRDADIRAFIADVSRVTGRTFIIDPRVRGTVSVASDERLTREELFEVLLTTLRANGLVAIPAGDGAYRIAPEEGAAQQPGVGPGAIAGFATEVFRLRNVSAATAVESLRPLVGRQGVVSASAQGNSLIVSDYADNLRRLRGIIGQIDADRALTETVTLQNSSAREIAGVLNGLLNPPGAAVGARNPLVSVVVVESSNSLLLRGDPETVRRLLPVIADLDRRAEASADVRVIRLQHADAEEMLPVLQQLVGAPVTQPSGPEGLGQGSGFDERAGQFGGGARRTTTPVRPATGATGSVGGAGLAGGGSGGQANIARYPGANALVIAADAQTQQMLAEVIRQLDVRREQIQIEAVIVEISDTAAKELGVQFLFAGENGFGSTNYSDSAPNLLALTGAVAGGNVLGEEVAAGLREAAVNSLLATPGALLGGGRLINDDALFSFIINAVKRDTASNLLQTPSIMTLNNREAHILVGQEVPVSTGEVLGDNNANPFRTIERQNVGIQLDVRPQVNAGGAITLFLRQEVSSVAPGTIAGEPVFDKREFETTILADDGEIIAIGGLLDQNETLRNTRVPVLGDIPVVGELFKSRGRQRGKRNLVAFIRASIVRTPEQARAISAARYDAVRAEQFRSEQAGGAPPGAAPSIDAVFTEYLRANPPVVRPLEAPVAPQPAPSAPVQTEPLPPVGEAPR